MPLLVQIHPGDPRPIYQQIMDEVHRAVAQGELERDEPLPSVRALAVELRLNPNTVQQAYRELERQGLVHVRRGRGTFVAPRPKAAKSSRRAAEIAERALQEAWRQGLSAEQLLDAIRAVEDRTRGKRAQ